ncbi:MAG: DUF3883 domain-containing protein [Stomatobaculum sp.]|nr:DUF3883 domain-containing protein [Stomatobaculum sp.]
MNRDRLREVLEFYKTHYEEIRRREDYKWEASAAWQAASPMSAADFPEALREGLKKTGNLLDSGHYYPRTALFMLMDRDPEAVRYMFTDLYREADPVGDRITIFSEKAGALRRKYYTDEELPDDDQDEHAVSVYLFLRYPEKYYIYKYSAFRAAAALLGADYIPRRKDSRNLAEYMQFCDEVRETVLADEALMEMEKARTAEYPGADPAFRLLTEDLVICMATYFRHAELFQGSGTAQKEKKFRLDPVQRPIPLEAVPFYDAVEVTRYEAGLREGALTYILAQEQLKVRSYRIAARKVPQILNAGRALGEGCDLLSFNRKGEELYISVKVTTGPESSGFSVTEAERRRSAEDPAHYRLYRVYDFDPDTGTGKYSVIRGDLTKYCLNPASYRVFFS